MSLAFFKSPRQIIFIIFGLENKKSKDQMQMPSSPLGPSASRMLRLSMLHRLRILFFIFIDSVLD